MKKILSCILILALLAAGTTLSFAASDIVFENDATLQNFRNFFNNVTIKEGVTLTTKTFIPNPQGVEIEGTLTVESGAKIVGGGVLIFYKGSECKGMNLYYKTAEGYKILPYDPISQIFGLDMKAEDYKPEFKYSDIVDGWLWQTEWDADPFQENIPKEEQEPETPEQPEQQIVDNSDGTLDGIEFTDVSGDDYYYDAVLWAVQNNVTAGTAKYSTGETTKYDFSPQMTCTRGQVVTFLWNAKKRPEPVNSRNPFGDVTTANYFYKSVLWAVENNITAGTTASRFSPNESCTRAQVLAFLWRSLGKPAATEGSIAKMHEFYGNAYYAEALAWANEQRIFSDSAISAAFPNEACPRADIVYYIYRALTDK